MPRNRCLMKTIGMVLSLGVFLISGCAGNGSQPVIDPTGVDMAQFQQDVAACVQIAQQVEQKAGEQALGHALVWGLIGAVVGDSDTVAGAAGAGLIAGAAEGAI